MRIKSRGRTLGDGKRTRRMKRKRKRETEEKCSDVRVGRRSLESKAIRQQNGGAKEQKERVRERERDARLAKTGSQGADCKVVGEAGEDRGGQRRMKERTRAQRESRVGRGNRLGRQVDAARCEKRSKEIGETRPFREGERTKGVQLRRRWRRKVEQPPERVPRSNNAPTSALAASQNTCPFLPCRLSSSRHRALCRRLYAHTSDNPACTRASGYVSYDAYDGFFQTILNSSILFLNDIIEHLGTRNYLKRDFNFKQNYSIGAQFVKLEYSHIKSIIEH